jgi:hypothetical protein
MTLRIPICVYCRHHRPDPDPGYCAAFPDGDGIPDAILWGDNPHFDPFPGDHGIQFEPADEESAQEVERRFRRRVPVAHQS